MNSDSKSIEKKFCRLVEAIRNNFPLVAPPEGMPIGLRMRVYTDGGTYRLEIHNDGEQAEVMLKGGTPEESNMLYGDSSDEVLNRYRSKQQALNWDDVCGDGLTCWSTDWTLFVMMPAARAYYFPAYMITYAPAYYGNLAEKEGEPSRQEVAESVLKELIPPEDCNVWEKLKEIDPILLDPLREEPPEKSRGMLEYLAFVGQFSDKQKQVIKEFVSFGIETWFLRDCEIDGYYTDLERLEKTWIDQDFKGKGQLEGSKTVWSSHE